MLYRIRKRFLLLLVLLTIYSVFFFTHLHSLSQKQVLGADTNLSLYVEPFAGDSFLLSLLDASQKEIDVEIYLLSDRNVILGLEHACQRGVLVQVMLEKNPFGGGSLNTKTYDTLSHSCVHVAWTSPAFSLTHAKILIIDSHIALILNQNLTKAAFTSNREFDIVDRNQKDIEELQTLFNDDWQQRSFSPTDTNLLISPVSSRDLLQSFLLSSQKSIDGEIEVIDDPDVVHLLESKATKIPVRLIFPSLSKIYANKKFLSELVAHGVQIKTIANPYMHAKMLITDNVKAYVGSVNLTTQSMDKNREVGIFISEGDILSQLSSTFDADWQAALPYTK